MKIGIIGGGPAGMMAAFAACQNNNEVHIYEKNEKTGKKLYITGKGRCNITNAKDMKEVLDNVVTNPKFLYSAFSQFTNKDIIRLLNSYGLSTKIERGDRVFPLSDKSSDVLKVFDKILDENKIKVYLKSEVTHISKVNSKFVIHCNNNIYSDYDSIIIATGGASYPATGSTGDGYKFAESFGHTIVKPKPSLTAINLDDNFLKDLEGVSLRNVSLFYKLKDKKYEEFGELVFTPKGISGPIVLTTSAKINRKQQQVSEMYLDLKSALDLETLDKRLIRDIEANPNKNILSIVEGLTLKVLAGLVLDIAQIPSDRKANQLSREERRKIASGLKHFPLKFKGLDDIKYAIITSGGVKVKEINPSTMESKVVTGLFFAGEVIDVDALTGGYNLQIAYSTGYLAGMNASRRYNV